MTTKFDVFIADVVDDHEFAQTLASALRKRGLSVWWEEEQIKPGDYWADRVREALHGSENVVFVLSASAAKSNWLAVELGGALALQKRIIPVIKAGTPPEEIPGPLRLRKPLAGLDATAAAAAIAQTIAASDHATTAAARP